MAPHLDLTQDLQKVIEETVQSVPICPVCSGPTVEQGNFSRCVRCSFSWCEGCSGPSANESNCDKGF